MNNPFNKEWSNPLDNEPKNIIILKGRRKEYSFDSLKFLISQGITNVKTIDITNNKPTKLKGGRMISQDQDVEEPIFFEQSCLSSLFPSLATKPFNTDKIVIWNTNDNIVEPTFKSTNKLNEINDYNII